MSASKVERSYGITFTGAPSIRQLKQELERAERVFGECTEVHIEPFTHGEQVFVAMTFEGEG